MKKLCASFDAEAGANLPFQKQQLDMTLSFNKDLHY
jgi:hypothetical protein